MNLFSKLFLKKNENPSNEKVREKVGSRAGILCIILNTILAGAKIALGALTGAVSILADGFNNLTDCGSNIVSIIGFKVSNKPADKEHPFGHQRAEAISAFFISVLILFVAYELITSSIQKIITPEANQFNLWLIIILSASIIIKLLMFFMNGSLAKLTESANLKATAIDSLSDSLATTAVLVALLISRFSGVQLDGYAGCGVALFIAVTGIKLLKETISNLLGSAPDKQTVKEIEDRVMAFQGVCGIHDLAVHNYGPNKMYATVHVEVNCNMPIMTAHELADDIEKDFITHTDIILTVHIDPLVLDNPIVNEYKTKTEQAVFSVDQSLKIHDFRMVLGENHSNVIFDVAVPFDCNKTDSQLSDEITERINDWGENIGVVVTIERQNF